MAINATNYDGTKDYKIAEIGDVYHPNLLVNGDFQVNQRGQTTYTFTGGNNGYTLDMWRIIYGNGVRVTYGKDGVTVDNTSGSQQCYFGQPLVDFPNTSYSVNVKVSQKTGDVKFYLNGVSSGVALNVGENHFLLSGTPDQFVIHLAKGAKVKITYCDLFKGSIVYPHVIEDYPIAFARCLEWLEIVRRGVGVIFNSSGHPSVVYNIANKISTPTITFNGPITFLGYTSSTIWENINQNNLEIDIKYNTLWMTAKNISSNADKYEYAYFESSEGRYMSISCEPL